MFKGKFEFLKPGAQTTLTIFKILLNLSRFDSHVFELYFLVLANLSQLKGSTYVLSCNIVLTDAL